MSGGSARMGVGRSYRNTSSTSIMRHLHRECRLREATREEKEEDARQQRQRKKEIDLHLAMQRLVQDTVEEEDKRQRTEAPAPPPSAAKKQRTHSARRGRSVSEPGADCAEGEGRGEGQGGGGCRHPSASQASAAVRVPPPDRPASVQLVGPCGPTLCGADAVAAANVEGAGAAVFGVDAVRRGGGRLGGAAAQQRPRAAHRRPHDHPAGLPSHSSTPRPRPTRLTDRTPPHRPPLLRRPGR